MRSLEGTAVLLRRIIAACLLMLAVGAVTHGVSPDASTAANAPAAPRVLEVAFVRLADGASTVQLRLSAPLAPSRTASVRIAGQEHRWACHSSTAGLARLTCPVSGLAAGTGHPVMVAVRV
jgi:hypothetical protein